MNATIPLPSRRRLGHRLKAALGAMALAVAAATASTAAAAVPAHAAGGTSDFRGVNWADPRDNFADDPVVPSGLSTSDSYATVEAKARAILTGFRTDLGASTVRLPVNPYSVGTPWWNRELTPGGGTARGTAGGSTPSPAGGALTLPVPANLYTHDPSRIINDAGSHYFYSTGRNIPVWYTTDGTHWKQGPVVFPNGIPRSVHNVVPGNDGHDVWAPDIIYNPNTRLYDLYYAVSKDITQSAIGLVTSPTLDPASPDYAWTDRGPVVVHNSSNAFNAIDPAPFFDASGAMWLAFGSGFGAYSDHAIDVVALDKNTGLRSDNQLHTVQSCHCEASYVHYHDGQYYLFWNTGGCCSGVNASYTIHVARSKSPLGPYTERSTVFYAPSGNIHGPGQIGILSENGHDYYSYHYYPTNSSVLGVGILTWASDGWPYK
jgi:hypothetical protein